MSKNLEYMIYRIMFILIFVVATVGFVQEKTQTQPVDKEEEQAFKELKKVILP